MLSLGPPPGAGGAGARRARAESRCSGPRTSPTGPALGPQQPPLHQHFMHDFLQIKESFALISLSGTAVCAFQDKRSGGSSCQVQGLERPGEAVLASGALLRSRILGSALKKKKKVLGQPLPLLMTSFNFNYLHKGPIAKYRHIEGGGSNILICV